MKLRGAAFVVAALLLLGGCAWFRRGPERETPGAAPPPAVEPGRYSATAGHGAESVAELRAAPAPATPEVADGGGIHADERKLVARSFVRIGTGCYPTDDAAARDWAQRMGVRVGADKVLVYVLPADAKADAKLAQEMTAACSDESGPLPAALVATYYVRYKLPFGAQFRNLTADEAKTLGGGGVQIGAVIGGTPASEANLRTGDFVLKFNGAAVRDRADFQNLLRANMGKRVNLTISRGGVQVERSVRLGVLAAESRDAKQ
ncbi:MAG: PDZ domain-containing protein [Rudaea sp.]|uniref:PDZ domain-containing protein n=1 Tax=Rudaea sp. TaxID=2136325 RepID=UPI0039E2CDF3